MSVLSIVLYEYSVLRTPLMVTGTCSTRERRRTLPNADAPRLMSSSYLGPSRAYLG